MRKAAGPAGYSRRTAALAVFFLVIALPLTGQSLEEVLSRSRYSPAEREEVGRQFREAERQEIPVELLLPRLEEGLAKKVPAGRLLAVLRREQDLLLEARSLLLELDGGARLAADRASWARAANLLAGGYGSGEVRELARASLARPGDFRAAASLYVSLRGWGLPSDSSLDIARALLTSPVPGQRFPGIMEILVEGRRLRLPPETLTRRLLQHLPEVKTIEELRQKCLQP
jgi:hypothetical protein